MSLQIIGSNLIGTGTAVDLGTTDSLLVATGVTVGSTDATCVQGTGSNHVVNVLGTVSANDTAISLGSTTVDNENVVNIGETGYVAGFGTGATVFLSGYECSVVNRGVIWGTAIGIQMVGDHPSTSSNIVNHGLIEAGVYGIYRGATSTERLQVENFGTIDSGQAAFYHTGAAIAHIINNGFITSNSTSSTIVFGSNDDVYDGRNGIVEGGVSGGGGADTLFGGNEDNELFGGEGEDTLEGGAGDDTLDGGIDNDTIDGGGGNDEIDGGLGADVMDGGADNDSYFVDDVGDQTIEVAGGGTDSVRSWINWTLGANVEHLQLIGAATSATGNALDNELIGNGVNNVLNGRGGADWMEGFGGNDSYFVDNAGDQTVETVGGGTDTVRSWISWTLADNVERLQLLGVESNNATGNTLGNELFGNAGNNVLNGRAGADRMEGFGGNDSYFVDVTGDQTIEAAGGGIDTVRAWTTWTLGANLERLQLLGTTQSLNGAGNSLNNEIFGNAGNNRLAGWAGNDTLTGGAGLDTFIFNTALNATTNRDTITDFSVADDTIRLDDAIFTAIGPVGTLAAAAFTIGAAATTAAHRIVYNSTTGALIYDSNGNGAGGATQFAVLGTGLALTNADFLIA
jgi:Ca2+-binding RTX toxin-like protein